MPKPNLFEDKNTLLLEKDRFLELAYLKYLEYKVACNDIFKFYDSDDEMFDEEFALRELPRVLHNFQRLSELVDKYNQFNLENY